MGEARQFFEYWLRVARGAADFSASFATEWKKGVVSVLSFGVTWIGIYLGFVEGQSASGYAYIALTGVAALGVVFIFLFVVGLILLPPKLDQQLQDEKVALAAGSEALARELQGQNSLREMFETARSKWEAGHQIYISRAKLGAKPWREAAWNWRSETMVAFIGDERITASFQWRSYAEFKDSVSNPDQAFHLQFKETLEMLARVRDKLEREISASAVSSKASLPTVAAS